MKAVVFREHGGPDVLSYEEIVEPEVGPFDVLVRVRAAAMNHLDLWNRRGMPGIKIPMPHISGCEGAGEVVEVGSCVNHIKKGDAVVVTPGWSCNRCEYCLGQQESMCLSYGMIGVQRHGCFAEYVSAPADTIYPLPASLNFEQAASVPLVFLTAWHMLVTRARVQPGETVLVQAAGSGVGIAAIQIAKLWGARVIATAGSDEKLEKARALGADILINYLKQDFEQEIKTLTAKRGVDVIVEHTGEQLWSKNILSLARTGRLVTCGATSGPNATLDLRYVFRRQLTIHGSWMGGKKDLFDVLRFVSAGKLIPVIDSIFPLSQLRDAERKMEDRNIFGKIVVKP